jgi:hypothetical protein
MRQRSVLALAVVTASLIACACFAMYSVADRGLWPDSWPKQLDPLRPQARTLAHGQHTVYEIPFTKRAEFESAWPHILTVASEHAPLVLLSSPDKWLGDSIAAGVRIRCPPTGQLVTFQGTKITSIYPPGSESAIADGKFLKVGPPWPDDIKSQSGALPEYVVIDNGKWRAFDRKDFGGPNERTILRSRIEIEVIVDGGIVDLNRIPLPADAPIIDKRFRIAMVPDGSSVRVAKAESAMGTLDVGTADVEMVLLSSEAGILRFSGSGGGKWQVPAGRYTAVQAQLAKTDAAGAKWRFAALGPGKEEGLDIRAGETRVLRLGPPLKTRIETRAMGDGSISILLGPPVKTRIETRAIGDGSISVSLALEGQAGEQYAPRAVKGNEMPQPPKLKILDEAGKILAQGNFEYG